MERSRAQDKEGIFARRFAADGTPLGDEILVNTTLAGMQEKPAIAMNSSGQFVIAWSGNGAGDVDGVFLRRFAADGTPQGNEVRVNTATSDVQAYPAVDITNDGAVMVAWSSLEQDGSDWGVYAQRFNASGAVVGTEFRLNSTTADSQFRPSIAFNRAGIATVVWSSRSTGDNGWDVIGRPFGVDGQPLAAEFPINSQLTGNQMDAKVAVAADGSFVVAYNGGIPNGNGWEVFGREFNAQAQAVGAEACYRALRATPVINCSRRLRPLRAHAGRVERSGGRRLSRSLLNSVAAQRRSRNPLPCSAGFWKRNIVNEGSR